jgi:hypothetical protein
MALVTNFEGFEVGDIVIRTIGEFGGMSIGNIAEVISSDRPGIQLKGLILESQINESRLHSSDSLKVIARGYDYLEGYSHLSFNKDPRSVLLGKGYIGDGDLRINVIIHPNSVDSFKDELSNLSQSYSERLRSLDHSVLLTIGLKIKPSGHTTHCYGSLDGGSSDVAWLYAYTGVDPEGLLPDCDNILVTKDEFVAAVKRLVEEYGVNILPQ